MFKIDGGFSAEDIYFLVEGFKNAALGMVGVADDGIRVITRKGGSLDDLFGSFNDITSVGDQKRGGMRPSGGA